MVRRKCMLSFMLQYCTFSREKQKNMIKGSILWIFCCPRLYNMILLLLFHEIEQQKSKEEKSTSLSPINIHPTEEKQISYTLTKVNLNISGNGKLFNIIILPDIRR